VERANNRPRPGYLSHAQSTAQSSSDPHPHATGGGQDGTTSNPYEHRQSYQRRRSGIRTDLTRIKGILAKALAGKGLDKKIERYEFILHWESIVGEKLAEVSKPEYISRRALIVRVLHPVWAQELTFMKPTLLRKLAPFLKRGDVVDDMVFRVGPLID
jgi:predicted nucleic acid-binding Zn ribbon protein